MRIIFKLVKVAALVTLGAFLYDLTLTVLLDDQDFKQHIADIEERRSRLQVEPLQQRQQRTTPAPF